MCSAAAAADTDHVRERVVADETVDDLVRRYHPLAGQLTTMLLSRVPRSVDRGDLESAAMFGLFQAARTWEPDRGVSFEAFARHRIRGALLDELRSRDWASRRVRTFARSAAAATDELTVTLGRRPTDAEVAALLGVDVSAIESNARDIDLATLTSADAMVEGTGNLETGADQDPQAVLEEREELGYLHDAVELLPERLRRVVKGYYVDEVPMHELARELGVTESRISQMRAEAVRLLSGAVPGAHQPDRVESVAFGDNIADRALDLAAQLQTTSDYRERLGLRLAVQ
jgi:RNA polymerase sigma factor for flagellar operon FliA